MRESFSNLKEFAGDAEKYFLVKDKDNLVSIDRLPPIDISRACNVLMSKDSDEPYGFKHDELFHKNKEDGSLAIPNLVVSRNDTHTDIDGIDFQNSSVEIPNSYLGNSNNLITINHAGGGLISIGDASDTTTNQYGISNGFNLYSIGGGITFPDWDKFFEIDDYLENASMPCQQNSYGLPSQTGCDICESRASNHKEWELNRMQSCSDHMRSLCGGAGETVDVEISFSDTGSYFWQPFPGYAEGSGRGVGYSFSLTSDTSGLSNECLTNFEVMFQNDPHTNTVGMHETIDCGTIGSGGGYRLCNSALFNGDDHFNFTIVGIEILSIPDKLDHDGGISNVAVDPEGKVSLTVNSASISSNFSVKAHARYQWIPKKLEEARHSIVFPLFKELVDADNPPDNQEFITGYFPCTPDMSGSSTNITCTPDIPFSSEDVQETELLGFSISRVSDGALEVYSGDPVGDYNWNTENGEVTAEFDSSVHSGESFSAETVFRYRERRYVAAEPTDSSIFYGSIYGSPKHITQSIPYSEASFTWGCMVGQPECSDPGPYSLGQGEEILFNENDPNLNPDLYCFDGSKLNETEAYDECKDSCENNNTSAVTKHWRLSSRNMGCENAGTVKVDAAYDCGCGGDYITVDLSEDHECGWKALMNE